MQKWTIILIAVIILLLIFIVVFYNYDAPPQLSNQAQMEIQMRKLWY